MASQADFAVAFGEMDLSPLTVTGLVLITIFVFACVAISSLKLVSGVIDKD